MGVTRKMQIEEGIKRLRKLGVLPKVVSEFKKGTLNRSENLGLLYWLDDEEIQMVKDFESENNAVVYHVIKTYTTEFGIMYSLLFVSQYEEEWEMDNNYLDENLTFAYVVNVNCPEFSEFGAIGVAPGVGGVKRTY